ncbi:MAG: acyltransferase [Bacteroidales bacterium]|nr:acyltransferase [Bacteroidales bacterium]
MCQPATSSKPRFLILDGLRGIAAIIVVIFHIFEAYAADPVQQIVNHGYLAVDFFFALSGFVIGYAYDDRWARGMTFCNFVKRRLIRLHPMVIMGSLIGLLTFYFTASPSCPNVATTGIAALLLLFVMCCLLIPSPDTFDLRGWGETYSLDGPMWTLMWEYMANLLYALFIRRLPIWMLALLVLAAAVLTVDVALNINLFNLLTTDRMQINTVIGGWSLTAEQLYIGTTRLLYPFFCGLLVYRLGRRIRLSGGFWWCAALVAAMLAMPRIGGYSAMWQNGLYEAICILLLFPLIVMTGAGSATGVRTSAACRWLGSISYPLYLSHYPLIYMLFAWNRTHADLATPVHIFVGVSVFILSIALALAVTRLYDIPIRRWLTSRFITTATR